MNLAAKNYIATVSDITAIAQLVMSADRTAIDSRQTYLRALVATTQAELDAKPRKHSVKAPKIKADEIARQVGALAAVHERFYAAVTDVASKDLPAGKDRTAELNRRVNFARTSLSAVRGYIRAGNDLTYLVIARLTKRALSVDRPLRQRSAAILKRALEARSKAFMSTVIEAGEVDKAGTVAEIELLMGQLAAQLAAFGVQATSSVRKAATTGAPLRIRGRTFVPVTATQVIQQRARPS